jgi:MurNAc alpha-1-phosphate uridylyltransferase
MKGMILAAGVGSRLKEFTKDTPKCLMVAGGKTLLEHVVTQFKSAGVREIMINVHHHHQQVIDFVASHQQFGISVSFSYEEKLLDTGGGLKKVKDFFKGERAFLIHNSDIYSTIPLSDLIQFHSTNQCTATLAVMVRPATRGLYFNSAHRLLGWTSESEFLPPHDAVLLAFSGISVASSELFNYMPEEESFSLIIPFLKASRADKRVLGFRIDGADWTDIGTPENLRALQERIKKMGKD